MQKKKKKKLSARLTEIEWKSLLTSFLFLYMQSKMCVYIYISTRASTRCSGQSNTSSQ